MQSVEPKSEGEEVEPGYYQDDDEEVDEEEDENDNDSKGSDEQDVFRSGNEEKDKFQDDSMYTGSRFKLKKNNVRNVTEKKSSPQPSVFTEEEDEIQPQRKQISSTRSGSVDNNRLWPQPSVSTDVEEI